MKIEEISQSECDDNDTPSDNTDDTFEVSFNISALNSGSSNSFTLKEGTDDLEISIGNVENKITLPADGLQHTLVFADVELNSCKVQYVVSQESCSDECSMSIDEISQSECDNKDTLRIIPMIHLK
ncbi:MAG: hypothetical protein R2771_00685 [Saprospiraceae bacterium]